MRNLFTEKVLNRFYSSFVVDKKTNCWNYKFTSNSGYGRISIKNKRYYAHRFSFALNFGEIGNKHVLHKCDNPPCVNPNHLFLGSHIDNMNDKVKKNRHLNNRFTKIICRNGHYILGDNLYVSPKRKIRLCVKCRSAERRKRYLTKGI